MKKKSKNLMLIIIFMVIIIAIILFRQLKNTEEETQTKIPTPVATMQVLFTNINTIINATGDVEAWNQAEVSAQVAEKILDIFVNEGDVVTSRQMIAVLDSEKAGASYTAAKAVCESAEAEVSLAIANYNNASSTFNRVEELYNNNVLGKQEYDDSFTALKLAESKKNVAFALSNRSRANEHELEVQLRYHKVRAPFNGKVAMRYLDPGEYISPGKPIIKLVAAQQVSIKTDLPEIQARKLKKGDRAFINYWASDGQIITGIIERVFPVLDAKWRTRCVEIQCSNENGLLSPGMFTRVDIVMGRKSVLAVPEASVLRLPGSGIYFLYVVRSNIAVRVDVNIESELGAWKSVRGNITSNDNVIVKGQTIVQSGENVTVTKTDMLP